jgi:hypothetical protein
MAGRAVIHVHNRSGAPQRFVVDAPACRVLWPPRNGMRVLPGTVTIPPGAGNWVGLCIWAPHEVPADLRMVVRVKGRISSTGKAVRYLGRAKLYQFQQDA